MKNKILFLIITLLVIGIGIVKYHDFKLNQKNEHAILSEDDGMAKVKGARTDNLNLTLPEIKNIEIVNIHKKNNSISDPPVYAKSYILVDGSSNYTLAEKDSHLRMPIASTTKIMTAIIALENYNLDSIVEISSNAASQIGSDIYLQSGEKMTIKNLLYALLVQSGNDAAMALAENMSAGGKDEFIQKMNDKAKFLGLKDTQFKDPAGLDDGGYSTASDLAVIASYALRNDIFRDIIKTQEYTITSSDEALTHALVASNRLIKSNEPLYYSQAIGVKTGYTPDAGHCLISAAVKDNFKLIGVVLNTDVFTNDASAEESKKLLEWGYENFQL